MTTCLSLEFFVKEETNKNKYTKMFEKLGFSLYLLEFIFWLYYIYIISSAYYPVRGKWGIYEGCFIF